jgi:hypothetical protein
MFQRDKLGQAPVFLPALPENPTDEQLFDYLYAVARAYFPGQTTAAEAWIQEQLLKLGRAKARAYGSELLASPWTWIAGGALVAWLFLTPRRSRI